MSDLTAARQKRTQLEREIRESITDPGKQRDALHTLSKLAMFYEDAITATQAPIRQMLRVIEAGEVGTYKFDAARIALAATLAPPASASETP